MSEPLLRIENLRKGFPGVQALDGVSFEIEAGHTHILLGENGAGKSTLVKILAGMQPADSGEVTLGGQPYAPGSPRMAMDQGVRVVHQELNLLPYLSIAENILFEQLPRRFGVVDRARLRRRAAELLEQVGLDLDPATPVEDLGIAQMQLVEIARAIAHDSRLLILDEPTAPLTGHETERLFTILKRLRADGVTLIYISHRLREALEIGDRYTVLRNGQHVTTQNVAGAQVDELVRHMVGRDIEDEFPFRDDVIPGDTLLEVRDLRLDADSPPLNLSVRRSEIVGIAGLVGSKRTEHLRAIFGADSSARGEIRLGGHTVRIRSPRDAVRHGLSFVTEDRKSEGLVQDASIAFNATLANLGRVSRRGLLDFAAENSAARELSQRLQISAPSISSDVRTLSGGNQQKVVLAKWLFRNTDVLLIDEPTRGIDVGAKLEIYNLLWDLAADGLGILMVSSDLPELLGLCHRIIVFSDGKAVGELEREDFDNERVLQLAYSAYTQEAA